MTFKRFLHFFNQCISHKENKINKIRFADTKHGIVEASRMADFTVWPSHDNGDRSDLRYSDINVIRMGHDRVKFL